MKKLKFLSRFEMMLNTSEKEKLTNASVIIFGVGGVGGSVAHMLVRSGISNLTIVDFDNIDETNINRQIISNYTNIGNKKVDELKSQLLEINPNLNIKTIDEKLDETNISKFDISNYNYIVDCIDDIKAKKSLIKASDELKISILSAMGAGNRYLGVPNFEIADIKKTSYDPIAKILRKFCEREGIKKLNVCYTKQKAMKFDCKMIGSVIYYTMNMASVMTAKVINDIIEN